MTAAALALSVLAPGTTLAQETLAAVTQGDERTPGPQAGADDRERCKYVRAVKGDTPFLLEEDKYQTSDVDPFYLTRNDTHLPAEFQAPPERRARCLSGFGVAIDPGTAASAAGGAASGGVPAGGAAAGSGLAAAGAIGAISLPVVAAAVIIPAAVVGAVVAVSGSGSSATSTTGGAPSE